VALVFAAQLPDLSRAQFCGGTVRDALHVVTAAHCVSQADSDQPSELDAVAGITNLINPESTMQVRGVSVISSDPGFLETGTAAFNDDAILTLSAPLNLSGAAVHSLPLIEPNGVGLEGFVSGWGPSISPTRWRRISASLGSTSSATRCARTTAPTSTRRSWCAPGAWTRPRAR